MDLMLDIIVEPDGRWEWKDEDEFEALVSGGIIDAKEAKHIWEEARRVIGQIEANEALSKSHGTIGDPIPSGPCRSFRLDGSACEECNGEG
jgi:predicted RNA-binding protein associated with RNAse of E/G family